MGLLLVDKPAGPTSHDVVTTARRRLGVRRIGHTGTLDPFATGLLLLLVGRLTRASEHFHLLTKSYEATLRLGQETDTADPTGEVVSESEAWRELSEARVRAVLSELRGRHLQVPPAYSARSVAGRRSYEAARRGDPLELEPRPVEVHEIAVTEVAPPLVDFSVTVSTGTYARALARDAGRALGCGGHLARLRRTRIGPFDVEEAVAPDGVPDGVPASAPCWLEPEAALAWLWHRDVSRDEGRALRQGRPIPAGRLEEPRVEGHGPADPGPIALLERGRLLGLGEVEGSRIRPRKVLAV